MDKEVLKTFTLIAEGNPKERLDAAMKLINEAEDQTLKNELANFGITMMQAKTSAEMEKVSNALKLYFKKQMALIFGQAFTYGQKYQHAIDLMVIPEAIKKAQEESAEKEEKEGKVIESSEDV